MIRYVQRDADRKVVAHFANEQPHAREALPDDHADIRAYYSDIKDAKKLALAEAEKNDPMKKLQKKVAELEAVIRKFGK